MTTSELKAGYQANNPDGHFFDRKSMQFFGDTMRNFGVCAATITTSYDDAGNYAPEGVAVEAWELFRRRPVKHGLRGSHYFRRDSFKQVQATTKTEV